MTGLAARAAALLGSEATGSTPLAGDLSTLARVAFADSRTIVAKPGDTAATEAAMLRAIAATGAPAPAVLAIEDDLLVIEALPADGRLAGAAWTDLAAVLETLHAPQTEHYGWPDDHRFGPVAIRNHRTDDWPAFWADTRLRCHLDHVPAALARRLDRLADTLAERLPRTPPAALLHGDLWGGNILVSGDRISGLIDPACYIGHREVDVAMLTLFDHPPEAFFAALALAPGWRERIPVYRLWPLLVHLRLFGSGYAGSVDAALAALGC